MNSTPPLNIKVVYSVSKRQRKPRRVSYGGGTKRGRLLWLLGLLNLVAAGGLYYGSWWPVDKELYLKLMLHTPLPGVDLDAASDLMGDRGAPDSGAPQSQLEPETAPSAGQSPSEGSRFSGRTTQVVMVATVYSWLTLVTVAASALALSAGSALGRAGGPFGRRVGLILLLGTVLALGWGACSVWIDYGMGYPPNHLRIGMGGLVLLAALLGLAIGRGTRGLTYLAAIMLILSAAGSAVALYLGAMCDAVGPERATLQFLALIFVIQSLWGWVLLPPASRAVP